MLKCIDMNPSTASLRTRSKRQGQCQDQDYLGSHPGYRLSSSRRTALGLSTVYDTLYSVQHNYLPLPQYGVLQRSLFQYHRFTLFALPLLNHQSRLLNFLSVFLLRSTDPRLRLLSFIPLSNCNYSVYLRLFTNIITDTGGFLLFSVQSRTLSLYSIS